MHFFFLESSTPHGADSHDDGSQQDESSIANVSVFFVLKIMQLNYSVTNFCKKGKQIIFFEIIKKNIVIISISIKSAIVCLLLKR